MKKIYLPILLILLPVLVFAYHHKHHAAKPPHDVLSTKAVSPSSINYAQYFQGKTGCFLLFDINQNKPVVNYNPTRCEKRIAPDATFEIALSLMAFDQGTISQKTIFKWDNKQNSMPLWNQNQTANTWLTNSVLWVSQSIAQKLGMSVIKDYLKKFNYGNQDFSGDKGKNNGLTNAWLSSSLKISADEQLAFLNKFFLNQLPVSTLALANTEHNLYLETSISGWELYGKTGTGGDPTTPDNKSLKPQDGWFVGIINKNKQTYVFVVNFTDIDKADSQEAAGLRAKRIAEKILTDMELF